MGRVKVSKAEKIKVKQGVEDDGDKVSSSSSDKVPGSIYKFRRSNRSIYFTIAVLILGILGFLFLLTSSSGTYLSAWYLSLVIALLLTFILSFPRHIELSDNYIDIHCVLEVTSIAYDDIVRACKIRPYVVKYHFPIMGSYGFGGYFGYYFNIRQLKVVRFHATNLKSLIAIEDVYSDIYIISCEDRDVFLSELASRRATAIELKNSDVDSVDSDINESI